MTRRTIQLLILRPVLFLLGLRVRGRAHLETGGPAIVIANHNSHLDTAALLAAVPNHLIPRVHPAAATDYFLRNRMLSWISLHLIGIIPVDRSGVHPDPLAECSRALGRGEIVVLFPEGSRGEPDVPQRFRRGIAHLMAAHPEVPVIPVHIRGAATVLPKGAKIPLPMGIEVTVGRPVQAPSAMSIAATTGLVEKAVWDLAV